MRRRVPIAVSCLAVVTAGCAAGTHDPTNPEAGCLYDSPLGAFAATFGPGDPCRKEAYATGITGTTGTSCGPAGACSRPPSHDAADWTVASAGATPGHASAGIASITTCVQCHDGPTAVCVGCHRVGGVAMTWTHRGAWDFTGLTVSNPVCGFCHPGGV